MPGGLTAAMTGQILLAGLKLLASDGVLGPGRAQDAAPDDARRRSPGLRQAATLPEYPGILTVGPRPIMTAWQRIDALPQACGCRQLVRPGWMLRWPLGHASGTCEAGLGLSGRGMIFGLRA
jgi:hypothetical protein